METIIKGGVLMLFVDDKSIPLATNHTLKINTTTSDISNKDVGGGAWAASDISQYSWEATTENLYSTNGVDTLFGLMTAGTPVDAFFGVRTGDADADLPASGTWTAGTTGWEGQVIITSLEVTAQNGENATFTATFTGYGALEWTEPAGG